MATLWNEAMRRSVLDRARRLRADTPARWGKFNSTDMMAHLNDSMLMAMGDLVVAPKNTPLKRFPLKQLVLYVLPFPRGAPTAPELLARRGQGELDRELATFAELLDKAAGKPATMEWPDHPAFGTMSRSAWGVLGYKHVNHHLRQFGV
jgi:hypothetical protein